MGAVEEVTIGNDSPMGHPFHLHLWPDAASRDRRATVVRNRSGLDVVNVPARGQVKVRAAFEDFGGRTVYHCYILDHEDRGMIGTVLAR